MGEIDSHEVKNQVKSEEDESRQRILQSKLKYARKRWICSDCGSNVSLAHKSRHFMSEKHKSQLI